MIHKMKKTIGKMLPRSLYNIIGVVFYGNIKYNEDMLITTHTCNFREEKDFIKAKEISQKETDFYLQIDWRLHTILWAAKHCSNLEGDFVECGVNQAFFMRAIVDYIDFNNLDKKIFLLDTYEGIPLDTVMEGEDNGHIKDNFFPGTYEGVKHSFRNYKNVEIIKGIIPDTLPLVKTDKIAFMSIDLNNAKPEIDSMRYFWDRVVKGGIIILDDYAYSKDYKFQREEWDKLSHEMNFTILTLATGQGMIIK